MTTSYCQGTNKGLIANYLFNKDLKDQSSNGNDGVGVGGLTYGTDRFGNDCGAIEFNGSDSYVVVPNSRSLKSPRKEFTIAVWFKLSKGAGDLKWLTVCCKGDRIDETSSSPQYRFQVTNRTLSINTDFTENLNKDVAFNTWYHYAIVYTGREVIAYLNAKSFFSFPYSTPLSSNNMPLEIGRDVPGVMEYFSGSLDELKIYSRALDRNDIHALYNNDSEKTSPKPCDPPSLSPPVVEITAPNQSPYVTSSEQQTIEARISNVSSKSDIDFVFNGKKSSDFRYTPGIERLTAQIDLTVGLNTINIIATNKAGSDQASVMLEYFITQSPPEISITDPSTFPYTSSRSNITVSAIATNVRSREISVLFNGNPMKNFNFDVSSGIVSVDLNLLNGNNLVEFLVENQYGSDKDSATILYQKIKKPPIVTITSPIAFPHETTASTLAIEATIDNVQNEKQITFKVNGLPNNIFTFNPNNQKFSTSIALELGNNIIEIEAENNDGRDEATGNIILKNRMLPPEVVFTEPISSPYTSQIYSMPIEAKISNISNSDDLTFKVNSKQMYNFDYDISTGTFRATIDLTEGYNIVELFGQNEVGNSSDNLTINYVEKKLPPIIQIDYPKTSPFEANSATQEIRLTILNVNSKDDITLNINGVAISDFQFNVSTNELTANLNLDEGLNLYQVTAVNKDGKDEAYAQIKYKPVSSSEIIFGSKIPDLITVKETITLASDKVDLTFYDHQREDGDIVSIILDGKTIVDKAVIKKKGNGAIRRRISPIKENQEYHLISKAWNLGKIPPNTLTIEISDGVSPPKTVVLESDENRSESIKLIYIKR